MGFVIRPGKNWQRALQVIFGPDMSGPIPSMRKVKYLFSCYVHEPKLRNTPEFITCWLEL